MKVNVHVTEKCNFHCRQCYAKFEEHLVPTTEEWMRIIDNCHASGIVNAYNFAGGEPLLYKGLNKLIKYAYSKGAAVSDMEYQEFVNRNTSTLNAVKSSEMIYTCDRGTEIVAEDRINGGYIMIDAGGYLVDDTLNTNYTRIIDCGTEDFLTGIERLNLDKELYEARYSKK